MIILNLHHPEHVDKPLRPLCSLSSGTVYIASVYVATESLIPIHNVKTYIDIDLNGKRVKDSISSFTNEDGLVELEIDINPNFVGVLEMSATVITSTGIQRVSEKWNVEIGAEFKDCFW